LPGSRPAQPGHLTRTFVAGVGYTGSRLLAALENGEGVTRDDQPDFGTDYNIVYTVPPAKMPMGDFLAGLDSTPERLVYLSTSGVYGDCGGRLVDETIPPSPESGRAKHRVAAENMLRTWSQQNEVELIVLRVPGIYGPGRLGIERIVSGSPVLQESDANPGNRIHVDDLVRCCIAALSPDIPGGAYNVGDGDSRSSSWFASEVARQSGLAAPPTITREEAEATFSPQRLSFLRESRILDLTRMHDVLGVTAKYENAAEGIAASL
jgi:nucleoside-diphosphate-sugar epimerase